MAWIFERNSQTQTESQTFFLTFVFAPNIQRNFIDTLKDLLFQEGSRFAFWSSASIEEENWQRLPSLQQLEVWLSDTETYPIWL